MLALLSACSPGGTPAWIASLDDVGQQLDLIDQAYAQERPAESPEAEATYRNMQALWGRMNRARSDMMGSRGMMMRGNMMGSPGMMRFRELNQQMLSYCVGMEQLMRQSGHMDMASMYGQMADRMRTVLRELPDNPEAAPAPQAEETTVDGESIFMANCASCHGPDGTGLTGVFPPLAESSIVAGDPQVVVKIVLRGLQGPLVVRGTPYNGLMPAFGSTLSDAQIAAALTYIRALPGNEGNAVTVGRVQSTREQAVSHSQVWTTEELGLD